MIRYIIASLLLLFLDILWISLFMKKKYNSQIYTIQNKPLKTKSLLFPIIAYIFMLVGLNLFVIPNISDDNILLDSLKYGFIFGMVLYGVYDFTNLSIFEDWNFSLSIIDVLWGGFVFFISGFLSVYISSQVKSSYIVRLIEGDSVP
jgi:uncharacterized membrane protein